MKNWSDLSDRLRSEVIQYLNENDRFNFAGSSFQCLKETICHEKNIVNLVIIKEKSNIFLKVVSIFNSYDLIFQQDGSNCLVKIDQNNLLWKGFANFKTMAYGFFDDLLSLSQTTLVDLKIIHVNLNLRQNQIENFPQLENLKISTSDKSQLFWILSKAENLKNLDIKYREYMESARIFENLPRDSKSIALRNLKIRSNASDVTWNILQRLSPAKKMCCTKMFLYENEVLPEMTEELIEIFRRSYKFHTNLQLSDEQFLKLALRVSSLEFNAKQISLFTILNFILFSVINRARIGSRSFFFRKVSLENILDNTILPLFPVFRKAKTGYQLVPNKLIHLHFPRGVTEYNVCTGDLKFDSEKMDNFDEL